MRYSTVSISLKRILRTQSKALHYAFKDVSDTIGVLRYVASMIVNRAAIDDPEVFSSTKQVKTIFDWAIGAAEIQLGLKRARALPQRNGGARSAHVRSRSYRL